MPPVSIPTVNPDTSDIHLNSLQNPNVIIVASRLAENFTAPVFLTARMLAVVHLGSERVKIG